MESHNSDSESLHQDLRAALRELDAAYREYEARRQARIIITIKRVPNPEDSPNDDSPKDPLPQSPIPRQTGPGPEQNRTSAERHNQGFLASIKKILAKLFSRGHSHI